jgi:hypothetical protein
MEKEVQHIATFNEKGEVVLKNKKDVSRGKRSKAAGARFELKVRNVLESDKWIVDKWTNNVDLEKGLLVKAKRKFNPFSKVMTIGTGFPDFIAFRKSDKDYEIIGVEAKSNGWLDQDEKAKCKWLLEKGVFSKILICKKGVKCGEIVTQDFSEKYKI